MADIPWNAIKKIGEGKLSLMSAIGRASASERVHSTRRMLSPRGRPPGRPFSLKDAGVV